MPQDAHKNLNNTLDDGIHIGHPKWQTSTPRQTEPATTFKQERQLVICMTDVPTAPKPYLCSVLGVVHIARTALINPEEYP